MVWAIRAEPFSNPAVDLEKTQATVLSKCLQSSVLTWWINSGCAIHCVHSMQICLPQRPAPRAWKWLWAGKARILFLHPNLLTTLLSAGNPFGRWIRTLPELWSRDLSVTAHRWERNVLLSTTEEKIQSLLSYCPALLPEPGGVVGAPHNTSALNALDSFFSPSPARIFALVHDQLVLKAAMLGVMDSTGWDGLFLHSTEAS